MLLTRRKHDRVVLLADACSWVSGERSYTLYIIFRTNNYLKESKNNLVSLNKAAVKVSDDEFKQQPPIKKNKRVHYLFSTSFFLMLWTYLFFFKQFNSGSRTKSFFSHSSRENHQTLPKHYKQKKNHFCIYIF